MNSNFFSISTPQDLLAKGKRDYEKMLTELNVDTIFNFFVTIYHVMDYVKNTTSVSENERVKMYSDNDFQLCQFLCNKGKHILLKSEEKEIAETNHYPSAFQSPGFQSPGFQTKEVYRLVFEGKVINIAELGLRLIEKWEKFFADNRI